MIAPEGFDGPAGGVPTGVPPEHHPRATRFADLAAALVEVKDLGVALGWLVQAAPAIVTGADLATLTTIGESGPELGASTNAVAAELARAQLDAGRGPCLAAIAAPRLGLVYRENLADDREWPELAAVAARHGIRGVLSVALFPTNARPRLGALTLYSREPGAPADHDLAIMFAAHAATVLTQVAMIETSSRRADTLAEAVESRDLIGQAKGMLMRDRGVTAEVAFKLLSQTSQRRNVKLRDLAAQVIEGEPLDG